MATAAGCYFKKETVECLPLSVFGITFILYVFGIIQLLVVGLYLVYLLIALCTIYIAYRIVSKKTKLADVISIGLLGFIAVSLLSYVLLRGTKIVCFDEFTVWGLFTKSMFESNKLYIYTEYPMIVKNYQAATAIFQFFIEKVNGVFLEDLLPWANTFVYFAMAAIILAKFKVKNIMSVVLRTFLILLLPLAIELWPMVYYTILVDITLGLVFGYGIYYYYKETNSTFKFINLSLIIFFLTCSKGNGLILSIIMLGIIYFDLLVFNKIELKQMLVKLDKLPSKADKWFKRINYKSLITIALPIISCSFTFLSWVICIKLFKVTFYGGIGTMLQNIFTISFWQNCKQYILIVYNSLVQYRYFILVFCILIYGLIIGKVSIIKKKYNIKRLIIGTCIYIICIAGYCLFLFLVCNTMPSLETVQEALPRYLLTVVAANILLIIFLLLDFAKKENIVGIAAVFIAILLVTTGAYNQFKRFHK